MSDDKTKPPVADSRNTVVTPDDPNFDPRERPGIADLMRPSYVVRWIWEFTEAWFVSRAYGRLLIGLPFLLVAVGGSSYVWWLRRASQTETIQAYEIAADDAIKDGRDEDAQLYLRSLVQQRPHEERYRFRLAMFLIEEHQTELAAAQIESMTPLDKSGYVPARVWLASQATAEKPVLNVTTELALAQLHKAISEKPDSVNAHQLLAEIYLRQNQLRQAEQHLLQIVDARPEAALLLARVQRQIGRSDEQIDTHIQSARERFEQRVIQNPRDDAARIGWSEVLALANRDNEAQAVLLEGLQQNASPALQRGLASFYVQLSTKRLRESMLNRDSCADLLSKATQLQPDNKPAVVALLQLAAAGATVSAEVLKPAVDVWKEKIAQSGDATALGDELIYIQLLASSGITDEAIVRLESLTEKNPDLRLMLARLYRAAGRTDASEELLETLLAEQRQQLTESYEARTAALHGETLLVAGRLEDARSFLVSELEKFEQGSAEAAVLNALAGRVFIALYDQRNSAEDSADDDSLVALLKEALETRVVSGLVLERLARLSSSKHPLAADAENMLTELLAGGSSNEQVYTFIGTCALEAGQTGRARQFLERAYALNKRSPMVLNNLSLALVRESPDNAERALAHLDEALSMLPDHPDVLSTRAEVYIAVGRWEEARHDLETALAKKQQSRNIHELLATVFDALNETERAEQHRRILNDLDGGI
ncbi:MAG: tetratricopeptide repeat protein [Planctomycetaceae bacterium]